MSIDKKETENIETHIADLFVTRSAAIHLAPFRLTLECIPDLKDGTVKVDLIKSEKVEDIKNECSHWKGGIEFDEN